MSSPTSKGHIPAALAIDTFDAHDGDDCASLISKSKESPVSPEYYMGFVKVKSNTNALSHPPGLLKERMPSETYAYQQKSLPTIEEALNSDRSSNVSSSNHRSSKAEEDQGSQGSGSSSVARRSSASSSQSSGMFPGTSYGDGQIYAPRSFDNKSYGQQSVEYSMEEGSPNSFVRKGIADNQEVFRKEEYLKREALAQKDHGGQRKDEVVQRAIPQNDLINDLEEKFAVCCEYLQKGEYDTSLKHFHQLLRSHPKKTTPLLASTYHNLGILCTKLGSKPQALKNFHKSVVVHKDVFGDHHPMLAMTFVQLGFFHLENTKDYRKSVQAFHEALRIRMSIYGQKHALTGKIHNNLGVSYLYRKDLNKARLNFECALDIQRMVVKQFEEGPVADDHWQNFQYAWLEVANILCNIGAMVLEFSQQENKSKEDLETAKNALEEALKIRVEHLGEHHPLTEATNESFKNAQHLYSIYSPSPKALPSSSESLVYSLGDMKSEYHPNFSVSDFDVSFERKKSNDMEHEFDSPSRFDVQSHDIHREEDKKQDFVLACPADDDATYFTLTTADDDQTMVLLDEMQGDNMRLIYEKAQKYFKKGEYDYSLNLYDTLLNSLERNYGEVHPLIGLVWHEIGIIHLKTERHSSAFDAFQKALNIRKQSLDDDHPDIAVTLVKVGIVHLLQHEYESALASFNEALSVRIKALGKLHPSNALIYNNIGCIHFNSDEMESAQTAYEKALEVQKSALEETDGDGLVLETAMTLINLGNVHKQRKHWKEAETVLWEAYRMQRSVHGPKHMTVVSTLETIADICVSRGELDHALKNYKTVLKNLLTQPNPQIEPACLVLHNMQQIYKSRQNWEAAVKCLKQADRLLGKCDNVSDEVKMALRKKFEEGITDGKNGSNATEVEEQQPLSADKVFRINFPGHSQSDDEYPSDEESRFPSRPSDETSRQPIPSDGEESAAMAESSHVDDASLEHGIREEGEGDYAPPPPDDNHRDEENKEVVAENENSLKSPNSSVKMSASVMETIRHGNAAAADATVPSDSGSAPLPREISSVADQDFSPPSSTLTSSSTSASSKTDSSSVVQHTAGETVSEGPNNGKHFHMPFID